MKTKSLLLAFAGLGLFACTNEDLSNSGVDGKAVVSVKILTDGIASRAGSEVGTSDPTNPSGGITTPVKITSLKLKLTAGVGGKEESFPLPGNDKPILEQVSGYEFTGVNNPSKVEVFINGDENSPITFDAVGNKGLAVPMYASTTEFKPAESPNPDEDQAVHYQVTLAPKNRFARLEFSQIKHADEGACEFTADLTFKGLFLNNIISSTDNLSTTVDQSNNWNEAIANTLYTTVDEKFVTTGTWPADNKCYGYNIIVGEDGTKTAPQLNLYFTNVAYADGNTWPSDPAGEARATVAKYKLAASVTDPTVKAAVDTDADGYIDTFVPGYVYRFSGMAVHDNNIVPPAGGDVHVIVATVTIDPWTVVDGEVEWEER